MPVAFTFADPMPNRVGDLALPERWLLWAMRSLVQLSRVGRYHCRHVFDTLDCQGIGDCVGPMSALTRLFDIGATRPLEFGPTSCLVIAPDEQRVLAALQHIQSDRAPQAVRLMAAGLAPAIARASIGPLSDIAFALSEAGIQLPARVLNPRHEPFTNPHAPALGTALPSAFGSQALH